MVIFIQNNYPYTPCVLDVCTETSVVYSGAAIVSTVLSGVPTLQGECSNLCSTEPDCLAWNAAVSNHNCTLLKSIEKSEPDVAYKAGRRNCQGKQIAKVMYN